MYSEEFRGVELLFEASESLAEFVLTIANMKTYVVAFSFNPIDVFCRDEQHSPVLGNRQSVRIRLRCGKPIQTGRYSAEPNHLRLRRWRSTPRQAASVATIGIVRTCSKNYRRFVSPGTLNGVRLPKRSTGNS